MNSTNEEINDFIRRQQLAAKVKGKQYVLAWIPYQEFVKVEFLAEGGFSEVYKAERVKYEKVRDKMVVLKVLKNSQNMTTNFLQEIANHKLFGSDTGHIVNCFGISQEPATSNYVMVMEYIKDGDMKQHLQNNSNLSFENKLFKLWYIARGLADIHKQGLVHRDLHLGNILDNKNNCWITDLGLAKSASETDDGKIYGIVPYIAPEVLRGDKYTSASDVYSFGVIMYEILLVSFAYPNRKYDKSLVLEICRGLRPKFFDKIKIPQVLEELIKKCWSNNSEIRPKISELAEILENLWSQISHEEIRDKNNDEFYQEIKEIEKFNQALPNSIKFPKYEMQSEESCRSQFINTTEIARLFQESEQEALALEIKKIEQEISRELTNEIKELINKFIWAKKQSLENENDEELEDKTWDLEDQLKEQGLAEENIENIIKYCERFIKAEKELEQERLEANIESITITNK